MPTRDEVFRNAAPTIRRLILRDMEREAAGEFAQPATQSAPAVTATSARRQVTSGRNAKDAAA